MKPFHPQNSPLLLNYGEITQKNVNKKMSKFNLIKLFALNIHKSLKYRWIPYSTIGCHHIKVNISHDTSNFIQ